MTKDLINGYSIFNAEICFAEDGSQIFFLLFQPIFRYFKTRLQMIWLWLEILKPCQKKIVNLLLRQIVVLIQEFPIEFNGSCLKPGNFFS